MSADGTQRKLVYDPLLELMAYYAGKKTEPKAPAPETASVEEKLKHRVIDGDRVGLQADLDDALQDYTAIDIINTILLEGMKVVGDLFGSGQMQLPFVLQSAEVMKAAVAYLEQFMDKAKTRSKGVMVLATVKGDVHDIGKNLVDIILTNNGYRVVNLGIKCPIDTMLQTAEKEAADAIGMSGLLVKSTLIMKENLEVMNERGMKLPVVLGGAALTRRYAEEDLRGKYAGSVFYAKDAFSGLHFMERIAAGDTGDGGVTDGGGEETEVLTGAEAKVELAQKENPRYGESVSREPSRRPGDRSSVGEAQQIPRPPFWGARVVDDVPLPEVFRYVNETALIRGQWQIRKGRMTGEEYESLLREKVYPDLERLKEQSLRQNLLEPRVVYGYFPCQSEGNDLIVYEPETETERVRFTFPRQKGDRHLCLADYFSSRDSGRMDVVAFHLVTVGRRASEYSARLFEADNYKEYLYFHGLSVESAEALAELWHKRIRQELGIADQDASEIRRLFSQGYQGSRYSFGYPACPDLEDQAKLFELLDGERIGVRLTDEYSLDPEQSTNAIVVHHPEARYFSVK
ncbi:MAG: vitamin B12 dependent-methionine synthase activation domain-containing protein [Bacteroidota bacterium]